MVFWTTGMKLRKKPLSALRASGSHGRGQPSEQYWHLIFMSRSATELQVSSEDTHSRERVKPAASHVRVETQRRSQADGATSRCYPSNLYSGRPLRTVTRRTTADPRGPPLR